MSVELVAGRSVCPQIHFDPRDCTTTNENEESSMSECEEILRHGIYNTVISTSKKASSQEVTDWQRSSDYTTQKDQMDAGVKLGLPIDGIPVNVEGSFSEDELVEWKRQVDQGHVGKYSDEQLAQITSTIVSPDIIAAWKSCVGNQFGLRAFVSEGQAGTFSITVTYRMNSVTDTPPPVTGFAVNGATAMNPLHVGDVIPPAGVSILFTREKQGNGYPAAMVVINTEKGHIVEPIDAFDPAQEPKAPTLSIRVFHETGPIASHPEATVTVPRGYKVIGGGARVNWEGEGSLLTASYPSDAQSWTARAKDHDRPSPAGIEVWAIALEDAKDEWEVNIITRDSGLAPHPESMATLPSGYALTGGGAQAHWSTSGSLLTASCPVGPQTWMARSKDHGTPEAATVTVYAIGIRPRNGAKPPTTEIVSATGSAASHPSATAQAAPGTQLVCGGAKVDYQGYGSMLTASYPQGSTGWVAKAKDHEVADPAPITAYAVCLGSAERGALASVDVLLNVTDIADAVGRGLFSPFKQRPATSTPVQAGWRWCSKCQGLAFALSREVGICPAGGHHDHDTSWDYSLMHDTRFASAQTNWRWCRKCQGLAFAGNAAPGACPAGGHHASESFDYALVMNQPTAPGQHDWRWCSKCQGLAFAGNNSSGICAAGGVHDLVRSADYCLVGSPYSHLTLHRSFPVDHRIPH